MWFTIAAASLIRLLLFCLPPTLPPLGISATAAAPYGRVGPPAVGASETDAEITMSAYSLPKPECRSSP